MNSRIALLFLCPEKESTMAPFHYVTWKRTFSPRAGRTHDIVLRYEDTTLETLWSQAGIRLKQVIKPAINIARGAGRLMIAAGAEITVRGGFDVLPVGVCEGYQCYVVRTSPISGSTDLNSELCVQHFSIRQMLDYGNGLLSYDAKHLRSLLQEKQISDHRNPIHGVEAALFKYMDAAYAEYVNEEAAEVTEPS